MSGAIKRVASDWNSATERDGKNAAKAGRRRRKKTRVGEVEELRT